jgi:hypothetical protein
MNKKMKLNLAILGSLLVYDIFMLYYILLHIVDFLGFCLCMRKK